jgi:hypothetical protein
MYQPLFFFFWWLLLGLELRDSHLPGLYHLNYSPSPFSLVIFQIGSPIFAQASLDLHPIYASCSGGMTGALTTSSLFCRDGEGLINFSPTSNHDPLDLCLQSSWDYRCEPLCWPY